MQNNLELLVGKILSRDPRLLSSEGNLQKSKVQELVLRDDPLILDSLWSDELVRDAFFKQNSKIAIFLKDKFIFFLGSREWLEDSYTVFRNKIGLATSDSRFLGEGGEVVLNFPYKDCFLEGGMISDPSSTQEIFYNEALAPSEVNRLLEPKALTNFVAHNGKRAESVKNLDMAENGTLNGNLLIKGNNLLALASLKKNYSGKVKLIYIDPPYNTKGADNSFKYNDRFNHSTWLTFMKNRLEIARDLLAPDGAIYVQLDYNEVHYCKVLMDEIFGRENFQREIIWRIGWVSGYKTLEKNWIRNHDSILFYSKNTATLDFIKKYINYPDGYLRRDGSKPDGAGYAIEDTWNCYGIDSLSDYSNDSLDSIAIISFSKEKVGNFKGQKNEALIKRIVEAHTREGDLVLDFFSGTGTTAAVCHKMNRRWIAIEQISDQIDISVDRLNRVINGDPYGVSKNVNWNGGGSFLSVELAELNANIEGKIRSAKDLETLRIIWQGIRSSVFLSYKLTVGAIDENWVLFEQLTLPQAKAILLEALDKNALYVNFSDLEDDANGVNAGDKSLNELFYRGAKK